MTNQDLLLQTVLQAKCTAANLSYNALRKEKSGQDITCQVKEMTLLVRWIEILEQYNCEKYQITTTGKFQCLTEAEAMELVAKVKIFIS